MPEAPQEAPPRPTHRSETPASSRRLTPPPEDSGGHLSSHSPPPATLTPYHHTPLSFASHRHASPLPSIYACTRRDVTPHTHQRTPLPTASLSTLPRPFRGEGGVGRKEGEQRGGAEGDRNVTPKGRGGGDVCDTQVGQAGSEVGQDLAAKRNTEAGTVRKRSKYISGAWVKAETPTHKHPHILPPRVIPPHILSPL